MRPRQAIKVLVAIASIVSASNHQDQHPLDGSITSEHEGDGRPKPNVVFILTDDQDVHLSSLDYMPLVRKHLTEKGTYFSRHYCTTAVCCPSRVTLWTGKAAHNTNVTDVNPPYGGYPKFISQGFNENYLPIWLQQAGYNTYYTGKLFNVHTVSNYDSPYAAGFTSTEFLLDPYTYNYMNSTFQRNKDKPVSHEGEYSTDVLSRKALGLLDEAVEADKPFFLTIAPNAPHCNIVMNGSALDDNHTVEFGPPVSAKRHEHLFGDVKVPRTENFNPDIASGANWVKHLKQQDQSNIDYNDEFYRNRLRALQAVDELVEEVVQRLEHRNLLENTYIVYSTDNGYHIGQHRLQPGKSCGYEEDINIPLIIRGPGVAVNYTSSIVSTHTDLAPTFFELLGIPLREDFDGSAIPITKQAIDAVEHSGTRKEHVGVEYWGWAGSEGIYHYESELMNNTYKAIRLIGSGFDLYYSIWCNNEHELYDMTHDPGQIRNLLPTDDSLVFSTENILGVPIPKLVSRLDSLLLVLKSCKAAVCVKPWEALHPGGKVHTLADALSFHYDHFYETQQTKVKFDKCESGYLPESEGPMFEKDGLVYRDGLPWHFWT